MKEKIIEEYKTTDVESIYDFEVRKTNITRERSLFAFLSIWINGKFRWLKDTTVLERKFYQRKKDFDSGWNYCSYWTDWKEIWRKEEIIK